MNSLQEWLESHPVTERSAAVERVAQAAGVTGPAVRHWIKGIRTMPAERVSAVSNITGLSKEALRPDIFGSDAAA